MAGSYVRLKGRNGRIWQAHLDGKTQEAIAEEFGLTQGRVSQIMAEVRASIPTLTAEEVAQSELDRIAKLYAETIRVMQAEHPLISMQKGAVIRDDAGRPFVDDGPVLAAINTALKIHERVAKMYGLEVAQKLDATVAAQVRFQIEGIDVDHV